MEEWLERYQALVGEQPVCEEISFQEALKRFRAGDELAGRTISASCLRLALRIAQERSGELKFSLIDLVQEANAGLVDALHGFAGSTVEEFREFAAKGIQQRLQSLSPCHEGDQEP